jgi:hypothetical protein
LLVKYSFKLGRQNVDFLADWAEITNQSKSKQITFYVSNIYINRLACSKGIKYKQISNEQGL